VKIVGQVEFGYMLFITHLLYPKILGCNWSPFPSKVRNKYAQVEEGLCPTNRRKRGHTAVSIWALKQHIFSFGCSQIQILSFLFDGHLINDEETPYILEMKDEDVIHLCKQLGGKF
jgi:hypothetical protein